MNSTDLHPDTRPDEATLSARPTPFFVMGFPRSGTTLLRLFLDAHPQIAVPFESFVLVEFASYIDDRYGGLRSVEDRARLVVDLLQSKGIRDWEPAVTLADIDLDGCESYAGVIDQIYGAHARHCGKTIWGDKSPAYDADLHVLNAIFPEAKFLHLIRDGRDVALSMVRQPWGPPSFPIALGQWNEIVGWSRKMGRMLPPHRYLEVRYEDLVAQPEPTLRELAEFLGVPFDPVMLDRRRVDIGAKLPVRSRAFHHNLERPLDARLAYQWQRKLGRTDQALAHLIAGPLLAELGYLPGAQHAPYLAMLCRRTLHWGTAACRWRVRILRRRVLGSADGAGR